MKAVLTGGTGRAFAARFFNLRIPNSRRSAKKLPRAELLVAMD
jgi:hypothetical protein